MKNSVDFYTILGADGSRQLLIQCDSNVGSKCDRSQKNILVRY